MHCTEFYKAIMKRHDQLAEDYEAEEEEAHIPTPATPSKKPKAKKSRPEVPRKKDGTVSNISNILRTYC
jgi:hypothetical protein